MEKGGRHPDKGKRPSSEPTKALDLTRRMFNSHQIGNLASQHKSTIASNTEWRVSIAKSWTQQ